MNNNNLLNNDSLVWWLEDDWDVIKNYNIFNIINNILFIDGCNALNFTSKAPLCSFRAGPIMNSYFFKKFFDISKIFDIKKDPEYKVSKSIRYNQIIDEYNNIYITCIFISSLINPPYKLDNESIWWYNERFKNTKFKKDNGFKFILAILENSNSSNLKYNIYKNTSECKLNNFNDLKYFKTIKFENFSDLFINSSINYFNIVPYIFEDVGREFNKKFNIIK